MPVKPRVLTLAVVAVAGLVAVSLAMCGTTHPPGGDAAKHTVMATSPPAAPPSAAPPPPPPADRDYVEGLVESVSGNAIALRTRTGNATVDFAPFTRVVEVTPARLSDVTPGSCVNVHATPTNAPSGGSITAESVTITPAVDAAGTCPPPAGFYGTVASVSGNSISVDAGPGGKPPTTVTVVNTTFYRKQTTTNTRAIANGRCLGAQGTGRDGVLQATIISLQACPPMGGHHHHLHLPHLHL